MERATADEPRSRWTRSAGAATLPDASAVGGGVAWLAVVATGELTDVLEIVALAILVLVPLGVRLAARPSDEALPPDDATVSDGATPPDDAAPGGLYRLVAIGQPIAAVPAVAALWLDRGLVAASLAIPWAVVAVVVAAIGLRRLDERLQVRAVLAGPGRRGAAADVVDRLRGSIAAVTLDAGLVYVAVGAGALVVDRAGVSLVFDQILITLTAVHFHYAGFALPVVAGLAGRRAPDGRLGVVFRATTAVVAVGPGLIGVGITGAALSLPGAAALEFVVVAAFTTAVALLSLATIAGVVPRLASRPQRVLLVVASLSITASMGFAVCYGLARLTGGTYFGIHAAAFGRMVQYHGQLNAFGFALPALVAWRLSPPGSESDG